MRGWRQVGGSGGVQWVSSGCSVGVQWVFSGCSVGVQRRAHAAAQHAQRMGFSPAINVPSEIGSSGAHASTTPLQTHRPAPPPAPGGCWRAGRAAGHDPPPAAAGRRACQTSGRTLRELRRGGKERESALGGKALLRPKHAAAAAGTQAEKEEATTGQPWWQSWVKCAQLAAGCRPCRSRSRPGRQVEALLWGCLIARQRWAHARQALPAGSPAWLLLWVMPYRL